MKCQRCWSDQEPALRVYTDALNIKVCGTVRQGGPWTGIAVESSRVEEKVKARGEDGLDLRIVGQGLTCCR